MKQSALRRVFIFRGRGIGLDYYKSKDFMSRVVVSLLEMLFLWMLMIHL